jgi:hypothetical protein
MMDKMKVDEQLNVREVIHNDIHKEINKEIHKDRRA